MISQEAEHIQQKLLAYTQALHAHRGYNRASYTIISLNGYKCQIAEKPTYKCNRISRALLITNGNRNGISLPIGNVIGRVWPISLGTPRAFIAGEHCYTLVCNTVKWGIRGVPEGPIYGGIGRGVFI